MNMLIPLALPALLLLSGSAIARPHLDQTERPWVPRALADEQARLERELTLARVSTGLGAVVAVAGVVASVYSAGMCDDYRDPADDCGTAQPLAIIGSLLVFALGTGFVVKGAIDWTSASKALEQVERRVKPTFVPRSGGGLLGLSWHY